jgi:nicotinate phosphoribosyltransferase
MKVNSLLDIDLYKLTMMQLAWKFFDKLEVKYAFNNRTNIDLKSIIDVNELRKELEDTRTLSFSKEDILYLKSIDIFEMGFLNSLFNYELPEIVVTDDFEISTTGYWKDAILWETIVLSTVNQMYYESKYGDTDITEIGLERLKSKLDLFKELNIPRVITDFGTRRRFSHEWHEKVIRQIYKHPSFAGTSNVYFAKKYNITPIGTNAHELYMISAGYYGSDDEKLLQSHSNIMHLWYNMFGEKLSIGLTDTFGTDFFFNDFKDKAEKWKGVRHDSGDPFEFGEKVIKYYESIGIDPKSKLIVFSDGLSHQKIIDLYNKFNDRINVSFGWGTNLTNDVGYETLSIVMKAVEVISENGNAINRTLVKLSDNLNKHTGTPEEIDRYKRVFKYKNTNSEKLIV